MRCRAVASSKERTLKTAATLRQLEISQRRWIRTGSLKSNLSWLARNRKPSGLWGSRVKTPGWSRVQDKKSGSDLGGGACFKKASG